MAARLTSGVNWITFSVVGGYCGGMAVGGVGCGGGGEVSNALTARLIVTST